ncbi:metallophosphoesterase family protein [Brevundimonas sp.]|uniref:metallophosphoesterase family protein n=1 Tax=Brevundimonas sp. TaxID=1871086 RepID=UPI00286CB2A5|nr:metallophosphoesterase family protein [Brevundimonas sp.]
MLLRLFAKRSARPASRTPPDCVVWAVGDIHGRSDLADRLIQAIRTDLHAAVASRRVVVFLGDYVDRGLDSRGVLDQLVNLAADPALEVHLLRGNHEDRMEAFLDDPQIGPSWCDYGGREALVSYGVDPPPMRGDAQAWAEASRALGQALPAPHLALLAGLETSVSIGDYFFAHAGARPGVALEAQSPDDLMWIRQPFLNHTGLFEQVVVHGHTPTETVYSDARRIGVDTGAYATNVLSAVRLERETRILLQATGRAGRIAITTSALAHGSKSR